jgi:hypothetical protein
MGRAAESGTKDTLALLRRAQIALFRNATADAAPLRRPPKRPGRNPRGFAALRGEAWYREDRFEPAANEFVRAGRPEVADKLRALKEGPYRIRGPERSRIAFVQTDPLPLITMTINGRGPFYFLIDTGGGELLLDPANRGLGEGASHGSRMGTFAGDQKASVEFGSVDSVGLGEFTVTMVPIRSFPPRDSPRSRWGARGPAFSAHAPLPFPLDARLSRRGLDPGSAGARSPLPHLAPARFPSGWWEDHYILAPGSLGEERITPLVHRHGSRRAAFTAPQSTLTEAGIALKDTASFSGVGGGRARSR